MRFLFDVSKAKEQSLIPILTAGQLITPLTRYRKWMDVYAIDNGCYGGLREKDFLSLLRREDANKESCLFVTCPDVVGDVKATLASFTVWNPRILNLGFKTAYVAQDGATVENTPWDEFTALFLGGKDPWKDSLEAQILVWESVIRGKHTHIGRVNALDRFIRYSELGAHTCDGSGVSRYPNAKLPQFLPYQIKRYEQPNT